LALSFGCADKGLSGAGRHSFYLALLIACRALAHVCAIIWSGKRTAASFRWFPRPQRPRAADNLAFAGRFDATVIDQKMGLDDEELAFGSSPGLLPKGQRRGLSGHGRTYRRRPRGSGIPSPRRPIWLLLAAITWLRKRHAAGLRPWSARRLSRVADGGTTSMLRRDGVRYLTPWTPSGACRNVCGRATASGIGGDRKGGDEDDRDDCQHCPPEFAHPCQKGSGRPSRS
jgi:hypothetical protein